MRTPRHYVFGQLAGANGLLPGCVCLVMVSFLTSSDFSIQLPSSDREESSQEGACFHPGCGASLFSGWFQVDFQRVTPLWRFQQEWWLQPVITWGGDPGLWSGQEVRYSLNWLELRTIRLALLHFLSRVNGQLVLVRMDNITSKAHVNQKGIIHSKSLMKEISLLFTWVEANLTSLRAEH